MVKLLNDQNLPASILEQPSSIVLIKDLIATYQGAAKILGTRDLGTQIAKLIGIQEYGLMCEYAIQGKNLGDALNRLFSLYPLEVHGVEVSLTVTGSQAVIKQSSEARRLVGWHHMSNAEACQYINLIRLYAGNEWTPELIGLDYSAKYRSREFEDFVSCPLRYGTNAIAITFPSALLQLPLPRTLDSRSVLTSTDILRLDRPAMPADLSDLVESQIYLRLFNGKTDRDGLAAKLGMSSRTLQRLLQDDGRSYSQLLDNIRFERARALLSETTLPVGEIAELLDYSHPEHFTRAFKRWSNFSPAQFRNTKRKVRS